MKILKVKLFCTFSKNSFFFKLALLNAQNFTCGIRPLGPVNKIVSGVKSIPGKLIHSIHKKV